MYRLHLTLLSILLFFHFVANAQHEHLLKKISIDTIFPQQIELSRLPDTYPDNSGKITIYKCSNNCRDEGNFIEVGKFKLDSLTWIDEDTTAIRKFNFYSIGCDSSGKSPALNNMILEAVRGSCKNSVRLSWNAYAKIFPFDPYTITYIADSYKIYCRKKQTDSPFVLYHTLKDFDPTKKIVYEVHHLDNDTIYEFVIQAVMKDAASPFSNITEYSTETEDVVPVSVKITNISVMNENRDIKIDVETGDFRDAPNFISLCFWRGIEEGFPVNYEVVATQPHNPKNEYSFTDKDVNPKSKLYYYQAIATHKCKIHPDTSNILTNILLQGEGVEDYQDSIVFHQEGDSLSETYYLYVNSLKDTVMVPEKVFLSDVSRFMNVSSNVVYQIISKEGWASNILTISHEPVVDFPTAFYPQSANDINRKFYPIFKFPTIENYLFIIYNRSGQVVYKSAQPPVLDQTYHCSEGCWDGTDGTTSGTYPAGIYAYNLSYTFRNRKYSKTGTFLLVR